MKVPPFFFHLLYFDHNATTPVDPAVAAAFTHAQSHAWGNPSSVHAAGQAARQAIEEARRGVAKRLHCSPGEIVFTSGGSESNNLALFGAVRAAGRPAPHIITTSIEHPSVLGPCREMEKGGVAVSYVPASRDGVVNLEDVRKQLRPETVLISVAHANNEVGTLQPVAEIAALARTHGAVMHVDGVQAVGKVPVDLEAMTADLYSISAHKLYAPKGCGVLFVRKNTSLAPLFYGGRHERERRAGTENVPGAVALCKALELAPDYDMHSEVLRDRFERTIAAQLSDFEIEINGSKAPRVPNTSSITFHGVSAEALVIALDMQGMAVSTGSACSSGSIEPSHVLLAMGRTREEARSTIRFSFGRFNADEDIDRLLQAVSAIVGRLRGAVRKEVQFA